MGEENKLNFFYKQFINEIDPLLKRRALRSLYIRAHQTLSEIPLTPSRKTEAEAYLELSKKITLKKNIKLFRNFEINSTLLSMEDFLEEDVKSIYKDRISDPFTLAILYEFEQQKKWVLREENVMIDVHLTKKIENFDYAKDAIFLMITPHPVDPLQGHTLTWTGTLLTLHLNSSNN